MLQLRHAGWRAACSRACAATSSCWTPARSCLPSARVRPRVARSVRSSGRAIRMTSVLRSPPAAPMLTSFTIQATLSPLTDQRAGKYPLGPAPPISRQSLITANDAGFSDLVSALPDGAETCLCCGQRSRDSLAMLLVADECDDNPFALCTAVCSTCSTVQPADQLLADWAERLAEHRRPGDKVQWRDYVGVYLRDANGDQAEIDIAGRVYRVSRAELQPIGL